MQDWIKRTIAIFPFYLKCARWAVSGAWGAIGVITTLLPLVVAFLADSPTLSARFPWAAQLAAGSGWKIPAAVGLIALCVRFIYGPYKLYSEKTDEVEKLNEYIRPKLDLACDKTVPGCVVDTKFGNSGTQVNYFRIKVTSESMKPLTKCTGFITSISKGGTVIMGHESVQLTFAPAHDPDALSKTLYARVPTFLDILAITEPGMVVICTKGFTIPFSIGGGVFNTHGVYIIRVTISGRRMSSVTASLKFDWTGDWKHSDLSLIGVST